jgi:hypothetical protein
MFRESWLKCRVADGAFPSEFVVLGNSSQGRVFSFFASREMLRFDDALPLRGEIEALVRVHLLLTSGDLSLISLPVVPLESSQTVTVPSNQLVAA